MTDQIDPPKPAQCPEPFERRPFDPDEVRARAFSEAWDLLDRKGRLAKTD